MLHATSMASNSHNGHVEYYLHQSAASLNAHTQVSPLLKTLLAHMHVKRRGIVNSPCSS